MKQARAFGVGVVLVTQNPVDLDHKALSNTSTWRIGRLQADRDKLRILDALEGISVVSGERFNRKEMDRIIMGLDKRIFLMHNVHEDAPVIFSSRWAMSYLRGPLTRDQIRTLMEPVRSRMAFAQPPGLDPLAFEEMSPREGNERPVLPPSIPEFFIKSDPRNPVMYRPMILGMAQMRFSDARKDVDLMRGVCLLAPITDDPVPVSWERSREVEMALSGLESNPAESARFSVLPPAASVPGNYTSWGRDLITWLVSSQKIEILRSATLNRHSKVGETESDFRIRRHMEAREMLDEEKEKLRKRFAAKYASLDERIRKTGIALERERDQASYQKHQSTISLGSTLLDAVMGRKIGRSAHILHSHRSDRHIG